MTRDYIELTEYIGRLEVYLVIVISLFVIAVAATAFLLLWPFNDEEDE